MNKLLAKIHWNIMNRCFDVIAQRPPDFVVGGGDDPYLQRWYITPWRRWRETYKHSPVLYHRLLLLVAKLLPNLYLHRFLRSDDDRAHHDHPWLFNTSLLVHGVIHECTISAGGIEHRRCLLARDWRFRWGPAPHRIELITESCLTLFVTGPVVRDWGFHCRDAGWIPWQKFTAPDDAGVVGHGCDVP